MTPTDGSLAVLEQESDLAAFCPHCHSPLEVFDARTKRVWIALGGRSNGRVGSLLINPRLETCERLCPAEWNGDGLVDDVRCPCCGESLIDEGQRCEECAGPAFSLDVSVRARVLGLSLCARADCGWRGMSTKTKARLAVAGRRHKKPEQDPALRVFNFAEVSYGFDGEQARAEASRCLRCKKPGCVDDCPVGVDIPGFVELIAGGDFVAAARVIRRRNALPAICGRVCPQDDQCEKSCVLARNGEAVAVGALERFAADFERETEQVRLPRPAHPSGHRVAVIGSGPAGLTVSADLAVQGHSVTVYESLHKPGGVLVYGIPEFLLPKAIVEAETDNLRRLGVKFELNSIAGKLFTLDELFASGYAAVYIGTGAGLPGFMGLAGENLCNVVSANEYLTRVNLMKAYRFPEYDTPAPRGSRVAVIGGGNVAVDCARTALRMGAEETTIVYRRTLEEMPARTEEIEHAEQEGVRFQFLTSPVSYQGNDRGWVRRMECVRMELGEPDESGRRRPMPIHESNFSIDVDLVVLAVGAGPNSVLFEGAPGLERTRRGYIRTFTGSGRTSLRGVWAGGDITTGSATVIRAMGAARLAADDMQTYLTGRNGTWP
jgi:glutamate synthase (NADPH) small chain